MDSSTPTDTTSARTVFYLSLIMINSKRLRGRNVARGKVIFWTVLTFIYLGIPLQIGSSALGQTPQPVTISFDNLATGALVTNQYSQVKFSASGFSAGSGGPNGYDLYTQNNSGLGSSPSNAIRGLYNQYNPSFDCYGNTEVFLDFPVPVKNFSFLMLNMYPNYWGSPYYAYFPYTSGQIDVYVNWAYYGTYNIEIPGQYRNPNTPFPVNFLSGIQAITGIRIRSTMNAAPYPSCTRIYYDDFTFTPDLAVGITSGRVSGVLNGTTQNALLGADVALQATIFPSGMSGGTYAWSATGPKQQISATNTSSSYTLRWTETGTHQVSVTYTRNGVSVSSTVNVQVRVPTLTSFSGTASNTVVNRGSNCGSIFNSQHLPFGTTVSMGCSLLQDGMVYSATATIPNVAYLSNPADTGIIFKQIVSRYRKRNNQGRFECRTARNPQADPTTGWEIDAHAGEFYSPGLTFGNATTITHEESDLPGAGVSGRQNTQAGEAFEHEAFLADDRFETYVYYFTGANSAFPSFSIPLHVADGGCPADRFDCGVDLLAWRFGPQVHFDSSIQNSQYRLVGDTTTVGTIPVTRRASVRSYSVQQTNQYSVCPGAPNTTNPIDGTRFFVRQLYLGILNREPDAGGWDYWLTEIAQCNFDPACIYRINGRRHWVVTRFFASQETFARFPGLANPPGSPGFDPNVYNPAFVNACYESFLDRDPDPGGYDYYMNILNQTADYNRVLDGFLESAEFRLRFGPVDPRF